MPGGQDPGAGLEGADEGRATGVEVTVMVGDGDGDWASGLGDRGFDIVPGEAVVESV